MVETTHGVMGLTRHAAEALAQARSEPAWLQALRLGALTDFERMPPGEQATGNWRYTSFEGLDLAAATLTAVPSGPSPAVEPDHPDQRSGWLSVHNGTVVGRWLDPELTRAGVKLLSLEEATADPALSLLLAEHFGKIVPPDQDRFSALHYAFLNASAVLWLPRGVVAQQPIEVRYTFSQPGLTAFPHTLIVADESAEASVLERFAGPAEDAVPVASSVTELALGANARLRYAQVQTWPATSWTFGSQRARLAQDSHLRVLDAPLGGRRVRATLQVLLDGRQAQADLLGIVAGRGRQHVDFQTLQVHVGDNTRSDLFIHNALLDRSSSNFTGLIRIEKSAHGTESSQEQKNILLSSKAKADSDPKLEILNNDVVRCTHGAAVGPLDPELLFYLQSRGLALDAAQELVLEGFFQSVLARLGDETLQAEIWSAAQRALQR